MSEHKLNAGAGVPEELIGIDADEAEALKARIRELEASNQELRAAAIEPEKEVEVGVASASEASSKARYAIIVEEGTEPNAIQAVPVQVNGRAYLIARGKRVEVPTEVVEVLKNAVVDKSISNTDPMTGLPSGISVRPMRRFPFQNLGLAIDAQGNRLLAAEAA